MSKVIDIDVRDLPAPEPLEVIVNALGALEMGSYIKMIHRQIPNMLLPILKNNGFKWIIRDLQDEVRVYIYIKTDKEIEKELGNV